MKKLQKIVKKYSLREHLNEGVKNDLKYWLSKSPSERIEAVEFLRRQFHGNTGRLQRVIKIIKLSKS